MLFHLPAVFSRRGRVLPSFSPTSFFMIPGTKKPAFTLHDVFLFLAIASKHARLMVLLVCFALTVGLTYYVFAKPVYYAHALVHLDYLPRPLDTEKIYEDGRLSAFVAQFTQPQIGERTPRALGVDSGGRAQ